MSYKFYELSLTQLLQNVPLFDSNPQLIFFTNTARLKIGNRVPNYPSDFYALESDSDGTKYFYCLCHSLLPDNARPTLLIGYNGNENRFDSELLCAGLSELRKVNSKLGDVSQILGYRSILPSARLFFIEKYGLQEARLYPCYTFFVHSQFYKKALEYEPKMPENYILGETRVEDAETVNSSWQHAKPEDIYQQIEKIKRLPTACIFHDNKPVSFEMVGPYGQLSHQYTFPEHRSKGLGAIIENTIIKRCIETGLQPFKTVEIVNKNVAGRSMNSKVWTTVLDEAGEPAIFDYVALKKLIQ